MKFAPLLLLVAGAAFCANPKIVFTKSFPASTPPYESISVERSGALEYKESPTDDHPVTAKLSETETNSLFDMAQKLQYFREPLESGLKVANTGKKTFRYEDGAQPATEAVFNYSTNQIAQQLLDKFEEIASSERAYLDLDRTVHFDRLGVNDALAEVESLLIHRRLSAPEQFLPLLNRISSHESFMLIARDRAARMILEIDSPPPPAAAVNTEKVQ